MTAWTMPTIREAMELRQLGMSYPDIAIALERYLGIKTTGEAVRWAMRKQGVPADRRRNTSGLRRGAA